MNKNLNKYNSYNYTISISNVGNSFSFSLNQVKLL